MLAKPGEVIILCGNGFGATTPVVPIGIQVPAGTIYNVARARAPPFTPRPSRPASLAFIKWLCRFRRRSAMVTTLWLRQFRGCSTALITIVAQLLSLQHRNSKLRMVRSKMNRRIK